MRWLYQKIKGAFMKAFAKEQPLVKCYVRKEGSDLVVQVIGAKTEQEEVKAALHAACWRDVKPAGIARGKGFGQYIVKNAVGGE